MADARWQRIEEIYHGVIDLSLAQRARVLDEQCGGDVDLRREVESLLDAEPPHEAFLERPAAEAIAGALAADLPGTRPPDIAGYRIIRELGQGGMGLVYLAEQQVPLRRLVALKVIRPGMDSRQVLRRFDTERQALARMDHPNIAAVYDAGSTPDGRPYFVMEFVDGLPIVEYADRHRLPTRTRLDLFTQVCSAVQHAHQKSIVHRDLKPSNVLVTQQDGVPIPKVIDFGTAKALDPEALEAATLTEHGMVLGTIEYMSPEQAAFSRDIDTSTDVYSLGVVLYELLAGVLPFERPRPGPAGYDDLRRMIRDSDPPKPSTQLSKAREAGVHQADKTREIAAARQTDAEGLGRTLRGDLDWITLKALEKDGTRRYPTVAAFAADIRRYLVDEPIEARPPSAIYRLRKFTARNRGAVMAVALVLLVLLAALATSTSQYYRAERARFEADHERQGARAAAEDAASQRNAALAARAIADQDRAAAEASANQAEAAVIEAQYREYVAIIAAADGELRKNQPVAARQRLLDVPARLRGWEWQHLMLQSDASVGTVVGTMPCAKSPGQVSYVRSDSALVQQDDGARVYLKRCDTVERWDLTGHEVGKRPGPILGLGSHGEALVLTTQEDTWEVVRFAPGSPTIRVGPFDFFPECAALSPDGSRIAVGIRPKNSQIGEPLDDRFELWDVRTGRQLARMLPARPPLFDTRRLPAGCLITFSPDSTKVATSGATVHVWRADSGAELAADSTQAGIVSQPMAFSPDGTRLAIGRLTGLVDVLRIDGARGVDALERFDGGVYVPRLELPDADRRLLVPSRKKNEVLSLAWAPGGDFIVTGTGERVGLWDVAGRRLTSVLLGHATEVVGVAITSTGWVLSADVSGDVKIWPTIGGIARRVLRTSFAMADWLLSISADGRTAATIDLDAGVMLWRLADSSPIVLRPGSGRLDLVHLPRSLAVSADGRRVLLGENDDSGTLSTIDVESRELTQVTMNLKREAGCEKDPRALLFDPVPAMALSPDGRSLAFRQANCLVVRDLASVRTLAVLREHLYDFAFRPDGSLLVASESRKGLPLLGEREKAPDTTRIRIWDWRGGRVRAEIPSPRRSVDRTSVVWKLAQSGDGSRIAVRAGRIGVSTAVVSIWDGELKTELGRLPVPADTTLVALSADGRRAATAGLDMSVRIWDVDRRQQLLVLDDDDQHLALTFARDGRLVAGRASGGLTIWESQRSSCTSCPPAIAQNAPGSKPAGR